MPNFGLTTRRFKTCDAGAWRNEGKSPSRSAAVLTDREQIVEKGKCWWYKRNCVACHNIDGWGGEIRNLIQSKGMAPPALIAEGDKVQSEFSSQFLKNPGRIRRGSG